MKRILMLGGADIQVSAIKRAKELGLYVITCDYLPENPGHVFADEYHNVSTTDREAVLALASSLNIDGVLAYASDPAALTAAYVSEKLNLPGNSLEAVQIMSRKDLFRAFMQKNGFLCPKAKSFTDYESAKKWHKELNTKAILKPVDSSGSKGITTIELNENFAQKFDDALAFSREKIIVIEEFIDKKGYQLGGDGFLVNGELVFRCFGDIHFSKTNPLLPCSVSMPTLHNDELVKKVHAEVQRLLSAIGMKMGALNFDIMVDQNDNVYIIEIGPRNGGNMIPELTEYCTGIDMKTASILQAVNEPLPPLTIGNEKKYFSHYVIHAPKTGSVKHFELDAYLKEHVLYSHVNFKLGDEVKKFTSSANRLGIMLLKYKDEKEMLDLIYNMTDHLQFEIA